MSFRVGQKVVCVDDAPSLGREWFGYEPKEGAVYTIAGFSHGRYGDYQVLVLVELNHPWGYRASRFRPVAERKTDISIFTAMLKEAPALASRVHDGAGR